MRLSRTGRSHGLCLGVFACLALSSTGCATDWNTQRGPTLGDIGDGVLALGAMVGAGFGLGALQEAGGDPGSGRGYLFVDDAPWERTGW